MSEILRIVLAIGVAGYFLVIICLLRRRLLLMKYSLLWMITGIALLIVVICPQLLYYLVALIGIELPVNGLFLLLLIFIFILLLSLTVINSKQSNRVRTLIQTIALLEKRVRDLEEREKQYENRHYNISRNQ